MTVEARNASRAALFRDPHRLVWQVAGDSSMQALNGLLTNDLVKPEPNSVIPCLALTPKGRPLAELRVWKRSNTSGLLELPQAGADSLREHFRRYLPPRFATLEPLPEAAVFRLVGPDADVLLRTISGDGLEIPAPGRVEEISSGLDELLVAGRLEREGGGWDLLAPQQGDRFTDLLDSAAGQLDFLRWGEDQWEVYRIEHGIPRYGIDFGPENLPQETGLTDLTVSFEKGCYTGQEVVARIHYRGHVNRRLAGLARPDGPPASQDIEPLRPGAELYDGDRRVGVVSSVAVSHRLGPIALGMIRREVEPGATLSTSPGGPGAVEVRALPFT
jgi:folate-binding protein YgfZ